MQYIVNKNNNVPIYKALNLLIIYLGWILNPYIKKWFEIRKEATNAVALFLCTKKNPTFNLKVGERELKWKT